MITIELADAEAALLLKLATHKFQELDNKPRPITDRQEQEYQAASGAVSILTQAFEKTA